MKITDSYNRETEIILMTGKEDVTRSFFTSYAIEEDDKHIKVKDLDECITRAMSFVNRTGDFEFLEHNKNSYMLINGKKYGDAGDGCQTIDTKTVE